MTPALHNWFCLQRLSFARFPRFTRLPRRVSLSPPPGPASGAPKKNQLGILAHLIGGWGLDSYSYKRETHAVCGACFLRKPQETAESVKMIDTTQQKPRRRTRNQRHVPRGGGRTWRGAPV